MSKNYMHREMGLQKSSQPNVKQLAMLKMYADYAVVWKEMSPIVHSKEEQADYNFLTRGEFLVTVVFSGESWVNVTKKGQSLARAMGIKLDLILDVPNMAREYINNIKIKTLK
tara:strand:- start:271 stop:609 length:339 start_codon:yes stop_codon:yes gene_type:complete